MKKTFIMLIAFSCMAVILLGCKGGMLIDCTTKMKDVSVKNKEVGAYFTIKCAANCKIGSVWGTDIYSTDSSVCAAGVHAGVINHKSGGSFKVSVVKAPDKYIGSWRNGVKSDNWRIPLGGTAFRVGR